MQVSWSTPRWTRFTRRAPAHTLQMGMLQRRQLIPRRPRRERPSTPTRCRPPQVALGRSGARCSASAPKRCEVRRIIVRICCSIENHAECVHAAKLDALKAEAAKYVEPAQVETESKRRSSFDDDRDSLIEATSLHRKLEHMCMFNTIKTPLGFAHDNASVTGSTIYNDNSSVSATPMCCAAHHNMYTAQQQHSHAMAHHRHAGCKCKDCYQAPVVTCSSTCCNEPHVHEAVAAALASTPMMPPVPPKTPRKAAAAAAVAPPSNSSSGSKKQPPTSPRGSGAKASATASSSKQSPQSASSSKRSPRGTSCEITASRRNSKDTSKPKTPAPSPPTASAASSSLRREIRALSAKRERHGPGKRSASLGAALREREAMERDVSDGDSDSDVEGRSTALSRRPSATTAESVDVERHTGKSRRALETAPSASTSHRPPKPSKIDTKTPSKRSSSKGVVPKQPLWVSPIAAASSTPLASPTAGSSSKHRASPAVSPRASSSAVKPPVVPPTPATKRAKEMNLRVSTAAGSAHGKSSPVPPPSPSVSKTPRGQQQFEKCAKQLIDVQAMLLAQKNNPAVLKEIAAFAERMAMLAVDADNGSA